MPALISWWNQDLSALAPEADPAQVQAAGSDLLGRWTEPHRGYHDTRHLVECFWVLEELAEAAQGLTDREATLGRVTAWFHDAVYDPTAEAGANEAVSALLAESMLGDLGVEPTDVERVAALVRMTASHEVTGTLAQDPVAVAFHDADLWILSAEQERYDAYVAGVRREYQHVPDDLWAIGRGQVLDGLIGRSPLYLTELAATEWTAAARVNLTRERADLH